MDNILKQKEFRPYIRGLSVWVGYKQSYVNYVREARGSGKSKFTLLSKGPVNEFITGVYCLLFKASLPRSIVRFSISNFFDNVDNLCFVFKI